MKTIAMTKKVAIVVTFCLVVLFSYIGMLYFSSNKPQERTYETYAQAVTGDAKKDHWMPEFFPRSATDIHVLYGVDPSFLRIEFFYDPLEKDKMVRNFMQIVEPTRVEAALSKLKKNRWREEIEEQVSIYVPKGAADQRVQDVYLALDLKSHTAWYSVD